MLRILLLSLIPTAALATVKPEVPQPTNVSAESYASASSNSAASVSNVQGGNAHVSANTGDSNANNSISIAERDVRQAPGGMSTPVFASHSCALGGSLGLSGPGFGVTGGKAKSDPKCDLRETVRILSSLNPSLALALLCQEDPAVAKAAGPDGCKLPPPATVVQIVQPAAACPVNTEREKKILERCVSK